MSGREQALGPWIERAVSFLMLPREHGAWAMLLMSYLVGSATAGWGGVPSMLLLVSLLLAFTSSRPLDVALQRIHALDETRGQGVPTTNLAAARQAWRRRQAAVRLVLYLGISAAATVPLLTLHGRWLLVPMGAAAGLALGAQVLLRRRRLDRAWPARLLAIAALSAAGAAAYYAATGVLDRRAVAVWLLTTLYSGASIFYVRLYHRPRPRRSPEVAGAGRARAEFHLAAYLAAAATVATGLAALGWLPPLGLLALAPLGAKALRAVLRRNDSPTLRQIGFSELGHTALFALLAVAALTTW